MTEIKNTREYEDAQKSLKQETPDGYYDVKIVSIQEGDRYYEVAAEINDGEYEGQRVKGRLYKTEKAKWAIDKMKVSCGLYAEDDIAECINQIGRAKCGTDQNGYTNQIICWVNRANWAKTKPVEAPIHETQETSAAETVVKKEDDEWEKHLTECVIAGNKAMAAKIIDDHGYVVPEFLIDKKTEEPKKTKEKPDLDEFVLVGDKESIPANDEPEEKSFSQNIDTDQDGAIVDPDTKWHERPTVPYASYNDCVLNDDEKEEQHKEFEEKETQLDEDNKESENESHYFAHDFSGDDEIDDLPF